MAIEQIQNDLIGKVVAYLQKTEAFLSENIPVFIQELLTYKFWEAIAIIIFLIILIFISYKVIKKALLFFNEDDSEAVSIASMVTIFLMCILSIISLASLPKHVIRALKIKVAPRVYLMDYVVGFTKRSKNG